MMRTFILLLWLTLLMNVGSRIGHAQVSEQDSLALVALYTVTNGPNWVNNTNWLTMPVAQWHGVTVTNDRVTQLNLFANLLTGPIPAELGDLTELTDLSLSFNQLSGPIPDNLNQLTTLTVLDFDSNQLTGPVPENLGQLTTLTFLDFHGNQLTGPVPENLGQLTNLTYLDLGSNEFTGTLPEGLGNLINLTFLDLSLTSLAGTLPQSLVNLAMLDAFWFNETTLCVPIDETFQTWLLSIADVRSTGCTDVASENAVEIPSDIVLEANYPNPFNRQTTIRYSLPQATGVRLTVFDAMGRRLSVLVNDRQPSGWHEVVLEAGDLPSGVYLYRLEAGSFRASGQLLLVK